MIADEMISPKIVRIISETLLRQDWRFEAVINSNYRGQADEDWIMAFSRAGGNGIISADRRMLKRVSLLQAIADTGLIGVYLPSQWPELRRNEQLAHMCHWWVKIELKIAAASAGTAWVVPRGLGDSDLRQFPLNEQIEKKTRHKPAG